MVLPVGRHSLARKRRKWSVVLATVVAPTAVYFAVAGDSYPVSAGDLAKPVIAEGPQCCVEIVTPTPRALAFDIPGDPNASTAGFPGDQFAAASRYRIKSRFLSAGVAPEQGLQVRTILVARSISASFPEIHQIGGVRPDALRWHPNGLALDVMIPNPTSAAGIALGNEIVAYVMENADRFGIQDAIWRGMYYTPGGARSSGYGHYDHVHVTTTGGGYPTGHEIYLR